MTGRYLASWGGEAEETGHSERGEGGRGGGEEEEKRREVVEWWWLWWVVGKGRSGEGKRY